jgi:hypothetical protein
MGLKRTGRIKPRNAKRRVKEWDRAYGSKARVRFVAQLPCAACGYNGEYPRQNAHKSNAGMSRKGDFDTILPLCGPCHSKQHGAGWLAIGMTSESAIRAAALTQSLWLDYIQGADVSRTSND